MNDKHMRVIVTRPQPECSVWVQTIENEGLAAVALPLIDIAIRPFIFDASKNYDAFVFVSRSAVEGFFRSAGIAQLQGKRCLVSGLGTRAALMQKGVQVDCIDAPDSNASQFDSEALWQVVGKRDWRGKQVLVVRGTNYLGEPEGRSWLADQLLAAGAVVDFVSGYERRLPELTDASRAILQSKAANDLWLFSSSQSIEYLKLLMPTSDWRDCPAIATHNRIFISALAAGFRAEKVQITKPVLKDVIAAVQTAQNKLTAKDVLDAVS